MAILSQHVVPSAKNTWSVRRSGSVKASKIFINKIDAEKYATEIAKKQQAYVYVHKQNGMIEKKIDLSKPSNMKSGTKVNSKRSK